MERMVRYVVTLTHMKACAVRCRRLAYRPTGRKRAKKVGAKLLFSAVCYLTATKRRVLEARLRR